ncbi:PREDICTED: protein SCAR2 [Tarenaya hassleriana]|uniref:protein SCAR2 n=1 Tax=Tarenaya hassleriana TaxID=28532 RepID=UPI00053C2669|nr:PREDICTED: protein SCAR2 [Tarenaya hassleriana]
MPLTRCQIRNEYGLADPELYRAADKDDPEALLEGVAMAGLVGILRQLGDLAEFAAEMFHDLHEEVMTTAARGHDLMVRVQQLEVEFPSVEKALLSRTDHSTFFSNTGMDWHPNAQLEQSMITRGDLPRCVMDSYEACRGPPQLFLLDKFDVAGAGACLKRYTDPSFFRLETSSSEACLAELQREKKSRKTKKRGSGWRNGGTPETTPTSHTKLHELFLEEHVQGVHSDPARLVKLKTRKLDGYSLISKSKESYMEKFVQTCLPHNTGYERIASSPELLMWNMEDARDSVPEINVVGVVEKSFQGTETVIPSLNEQDNVPEDNLNGDFIDKDIEAVPESTYDEAGETASTVSDKIVEKDAQTNANGIPEGLQVRSYSEDLTTEVEDYVDAHATMESETETDDDGRPRNRSVAFSVGKHDSGSDIDEEKVEDPPQFSDSQSVGNTSASENGHSSFLRWRSIFSYSDAGSISTENDPSDREKTAETIPSTGSCKSELVEFSPDVAHGNKDARGSDTREQGLICGNDVDRQASPTSHGTSSSPRSVSQDAELHLSIVQSLAPEIGETSPESPEHDLKRGDTDESGTGAVDSSNSDTLLDNKDPNFSSEASLVVSASEGNRYDTAIGDATETNCTVDFISENLTHLGTGGLSDVSPIDQQLPCSEGMGVEISPNYKDSKTGDPFTVSEIHSHNILDDDGENVAETKTVPEARYQTSVVELSSEHSPAIGTTPDDSVSEVNLVNRTLIPTEVVDSKVTSEVISKDKISTGDASSVGSEQLNEISGESHSSYLDNKGFHEHVRLDNEAPEEELAMSGSDAYTSKCSPSSTCSPSGETEETPSGAGELCHDKVLVSNGTLLAETECNPELERNIQPNPSEGLDHFQHSSSVALDDNDFLNGEAVTLQTSQNISDMDSEETKSPNESTRLNNCVDSSSLELFETLLEQSIEMHEPSDEVIFGSDVWLGLPYESVPQSNSSTKSTFIRSGLIHETDPPSMEEVPPLPPLPPMQWRLGRTQPFFSPVEIKSPQFGIAPSAQTVHTTSLGGQLPSEIVNNSPDKPSLSHSQLPTTDFNGEYESCDFQSTQSADPSIQPVSMPDDFGSNLVVDEDLKQCITSEQIAGDSDKHPDAPKQITEEEQDLDRVTVEPSVQKILVPDDAMWPVSAFAVAPTLDSEKPNEIPAVKLPRPRSPLVDAVAAHDRKTLRKVSERVLPLPTSSNEEENNSFLVQIRNKSFNLKPAAMTRPNIQAGPKTNLKVAAILEKANTIRQAMAGSDEDDDSDGWSDT